MENGGKAVRYECTRCGACCRWAGDVCIETDEIHEISRFLNMDEQVFIDTCCRLRANRRGLSIRDAEDGACMMLTKDGCRINPVKPRQCRDFPTNGIFPAGGICAAPEKWGRNGKHNICRDAARFFSSSGIIPWTG
ncbi:MAG: YkgJ family cysteine cluster protein [Akkermansia sp.]